VTAGLEHAADLGQGPVVVVDVLEIIEADDLVERAVFEGQDGGAHLDEVIAQHRLAGLEVGEIKSVEIHVPPFGGGKS